MKKVYCILDTVDSVSHIRKVFSSYSKALSYLVRIANDCTDAGGELLESEGHILYGDKYAYAKLYTPDRKIRWIELFKREVE